MMRVELRNKDAVAKRYGWTDYDNFRLNIKDAEDTWCYVAVEDVIKLEAENAELRANWAELGTWLKAEMTKDNDSCNHMGYETLVDVQDKMSELKQSNEQGKGAHYKIGQ